MKLVIAYFRVTRLNDVKTALARAEIFNYSVTSAMGAGDEPNIREQYRGAGIEMDLHKRVRIEVGVNDDFLDRTVEAIREAAHTGKDGDGMIFVQNLLEAVRIRNGARGSDAIHGIEPAEMPGSIGDR